MSYRNEASLPALDCLAVLIPAWQPEPQLIALAEDLVTRGFGAVLVMDDGSDLQHLPVFAAVAQLPRVRVLTHPTNRGKGRALKTGIHHVLTQLPAMQGVVTADADGQHTARDIVRVAQALRETQGSVVLGARRFSGKVPLRSRFGNWLTRKIFAFVTGAKVTDTQTGLRAFSRAVLLELLGLSGERYEYEMTVLAHLCRRSKPLEVPIETVYLDGNRSSHFDPLWDSMRISRVLVRYYAAAIGLAAFSSTFAATHNIPRSLPFWLRRKDSSMSASTK
jgi:glycosyltransferase involved in cell wall biosynthesis